VVVGGEEVVGELPDGVRKLSAGSIGVEEGQRGVPHGEQEAAAMWRSSAVVFRLELEGDWGSVSTSRSQGSFLGG
jgi:hypothetical protein